MHPDLHYLYLMSVICNNDNNCSLLGRMRFLFTAILVGGGFTPSHENTHWRETVSV